MTRVIKTKIVKKHYFYLEDDYMILQKLDGIKKEQVN